MPDRIRRSRPTFAQLRLLKRLAETPGAELIILSDDNWSPHDGPRFHGRFYYPRCSTCGHARFEAVSWLPIHALAEAGLIAPLLSGHSHYSIITEAGRRALVELANA